MADTVDSKSTAFTGLRVQVPSPALKSRPLRVGFFIGAAMGLDRERPPSECEDGGREGGPEGNPFAGTKKPIQWGRVFFIGAAMENISKYEIFFAEYAAPIKRAAFRQPNSNAE